MTANPEIAGPSQRARLITGVSAAMAIFFCGLIAIEERKPVHDELFYLEIAWNLAEYRVFGQHRDHRTAPPPGGVGVPIYPALLALAIKLDGAFAASVDCVLSDRRQQQACTMATKRVIGAQLLFASVAFGLLIYALAGMFRSLALPTLAVILIVATGAPYYFATFFLTEALYLPLMFLTAASLTHVMQKPGISGAVLTALLFSVLTLIRPTFYYVFIALVPIIGLWWFRGERSFSRAATRCAVLILAFYLGVGPWMARNAIEFDSAAVTVGYGGRAFSTRLAYNDMSAREYAAGWIYWLPDFGDKLGQALFGEATVAPLDLGNPDGYYLAGTERIGKAAEIATGFDPNSLQAAAGDPALAWMLRQAVVEHPLKHAAVTALLAWRGVFVEKYFGLLGVIALLIYGLTAERSSRKQLIMLLLMPAAVLLVFNAGVSLNIPRYNLPLLLPMALVLAHYGLGAGARFRRVLNPLRRH